MKKPKKPKLKRYTLSLSETEVRRLTAYASQNGVERPVALHRIVSQSLRQYSEISAQPHDKRQLCLFDAVQVNIFEELL